MTSTQRIERLAHANTLIQIIAAHGRRFFWHGGRQVWDEGTKSSTFVPANRTARLELRNNRVYHIDEYTQKAIYLHNRNRWRNFSHGGTIRSLVEAMRDYVMHGTKIPRWQIVIAQMGKPDLTDNIWGYKVEAANAVRDAAYELPIVAEQKG